MPLLTRHAALLSRHWRLFLRPSPAWRGTSRWWRLAAYAPGWRFGTGRSNYLKNGRWCVHLRYAGMRHGPPEVMARLAHGETVDPSEYYFRVAPVFEIGAERYTWLNKILAVGVGERLPPNVVRYSIFEIL
ncbi:MAG: DUF3237 domain-containing protein [Stellaceae bacterium]